MRAASLQWKRHRIVPGVQSANVNFAEHSAEVKRHIEVEALISAVAKRVTTQPNYGYYLMVLISKK